MLSLRLLKVNKGTTKCVPVSLGVCFPTFRKNAVPSSEKGPAVQQDMSENVNSQQNTCENLKSRIKSLNNAIPIRVNCFTFHQGFVNPRVTHA